MPDLKAYLADKYMSGPKRDAILARTSDSSIKRKKRKPKNEDYIGGVKGEEGGGLMLRDEDEWRLKDEDEDMEDGDTPVMGKDVSTFQKSKSSWATVGSTSLPMIKSEPSNEAGPSSPPPSIKAEPNDFPANQPKKRKGGLRTAAQMAEEEAARKAAEKSPTPPPDAERSNQYNETVHRDASGRVIDVAKLKEEEKRQEEEAKRKELERKEWTKGLVQRQARDSRRKEEKEMGERKNVGVSRDDIRMNREMQEVDRWNDPAAEFLTKKKKKGPRRPKYEGPFAPNRFGIPPGFRWDGVDRSNGFEKKYFQAQNSAVRKEYEKNQWSVEDM
ncbi:uncharacterized protein I206_103264 [Kwoniella pini CBS 10737]|uniref:Pre-mRNA-splicing factor CWC26 n=1 Tax=Kwoniella pini CBS 10737 TaxID=1296096 RepID=A0A1B9IAI8_9TREE|nr:pre-mRNA-splicing factor CWC26 [Kwoniella pini CBS 10737]OCF52440.1 pre-mRNA-splicing factor CWC26 [Kwoniella pini CBS 10737]